MRRSCTIIAAVVFFARSLAWGNVISMQERSVTVRTEDGDGRVTYVFTDCLGRTGLLSVTYYDREERPLATVGEMLTGELLVSTTTYNAGGQPTHTEYTLQKNGNALTTRTAYVYDRHGRLTRTQQTLVPGAAAVASASLPEGPTDGGPRPPRPAQPVTVAVTTNGYDALGRLTGVRTAGAAGMAGLTRTNVYDLHGWLVKWYCGFVEQQLAYADGAVPSYTGRISSKTTTYGGETRRYDYSYDLLGRLVGADYSGSDLTDGESLPRQDGRGSAG